MFQEIIDEQSPAGFEICCTIKQMLIQPRPLAPLFFILFYFLVNLEI